LYRRLDAVVAGAGIDFPPTFAAAPSGKAPPVAEDFIPVHAPPANLSHLAERAISQHLAPTAILPNDKGDILYISGRSGKSLEPAVGKASLNVFGMAREGLRYELSGAFATALREGGSPAVVRSLKVVSDGAARSVDLTVQRIVEPK